jgi:hypothetical protein
MKVLWGSVKDSTQLGPICFHSNAEFHQMTQVPHLGRKLEHLQCGLSAQNNQVCY